MYTVYQTTCLVNSKFYIGVHKTDDPNDDYLGSGKNRIKKFKETCHQQGIKNSNYGSMWITDGINNLKIKNDSIIPLNWRKGRVNPKQKV